MNNLERAWLLVRLALAEPQSLSLQDLRMQYYSSVSGLPATESVTNHQRNYLLTQGVAPDTITSMLRAYFIANGAPGGSVQDVLAYGYQNIP